MKRQYEVPESEAQREDDSFKLCFGTMLVFLALMVLTCVCFWPRNMVQKKVNLIDISYGIVFRLDFLLLLIPVD